MSNIVLAQASKLASNLGIAGEPAELVQTLKATAFRGPATDQQLTALLFVATQYGLNPFTREIYAFPDKNNGIVPVVGVDGWSRIINSHAQFDGMEFAQDAESCTCVMFRKDRSHAIKVTEWLEECRRDNAQPWKSHPKRMLRHKAMIQCARLAFGFTGIFDQDEAERIAESSPAPKYMGHVEQVSRPALEAYPAERFAANLPKWEELVSTGQKTNAEIEAMLSTKAALTEEQREAIRNLGTVYADDAAMSDEGVEK